MKKDSYLIFVTEEFLQVKAKPMPSAKLHHLLLDFMHIFNMLFQVA